MAQPHVAPYGSWKSPITSDLIVSATVGLGQIALDGAETYWVELRPSEGGRNCVVRRTPDGTVSDVTPQGFNARTRVHEYGGGDFAVRDGAVYFANFADQRVYRQRTETAPRPTTSRVAYPATLSAWPSLVSSSTESATRRKPPTAWKDSARTRLKAPTPTWVRLSRSATRHLGA